MIQPFMISWMFYTQGRIKLVGAPGALILVGPLPMCEIDITITSVNKQ